MKAINRRDFDRDCKCGDERTEPRRGGGRDDQAFCRHAWHGCEKAADAGIPCGDRAEIQRLSLRGDGLVIPRYASPRHFSATGGKLIDALRRRDHGRFERVEIDISPPSRGVEAPSPGGGPELRRSGRTWTARPTRSHPCFGMPWARHAAWSRPARRGGSPPRESRNGVRLLRCVSGPWRLDRGRFRQPVGVLHPEQHAADLMFRACQASRRSGSVCRFPENRILATLTISWRYPKIIDVVNSVTVGTIRGCGRRRHREGLRASSTP